MRHKRFLICLALLGAGASLGVQANAYTGQDAAPKQDAAAKPAQADTVKGADVKAIVDPQKEKSIRKLMEVTGSGKVGVQVGQQIIASLRQSQPSLPEEFWESVNKKFNADALIDLIVPIYAKYYTQEDIDGLIAFYQTPLGQKVVSTLPQISQESVQVGQAWGRKIAEQMIEEMQQRYNADGTPKTDAKPAVKKSAAKAAPPAKPKTKPKDGG